MKAVLLLLAFALSADPSNLCTLCHPQVRVAFETSIHASEEVTCVSCHGGDPRASDVEGAHRASFRAHANRQEIPALCASCHAAAAIMRPYDLPTDQYALYQTSPHGQGLARGDASVAVCTDCHGVHDILAPDDPASPTYFQNIPSMCARCHSRREDLDTSAAEDPFEAYASSVHGRAVIEDGNASAPNCSRCHGAHGAAPPGVGDIEKMCGQCHRTTRAHFLAGPHHEGMKAAGLGECVSCHDHHRVERPGLEMLESTCIRCHEEGSGPVKLAAQMTVLYTAAEEDLRSATTLVEEAESIPLYTEDYRARLAEAQTALREALPAMHSLDLEHIKDLTRRTRSIGHEVSSEVGGKLAGRRWRHIGLLVFWFYLLVTVAVLARFRERSVRQAE